MRRRPPRRVAEKKRAPQGALVQKVEETSRRQGERRLRTCPLKRSGGLVTSKLVVNLLVADAPLTVLALRNSSHDRLRSAAKSTEGAKII